MYGCQSFDAGNGTRNEDMPIDNSGEAFNYLCFNIDEYNSLRFDKFQKETINLTKALMEEFPNTVKLHPGKFNPTIKTKNYSYYEKYDPDGVFKKQPFDSSLMS